MNSISFHCHISLCKIKNKRDYCGLASFTAAVAIVANAFLNFAKAAIKAKG